MSEVSFNHRADDYETSVEGAEATPALRRSQQRRLLAAFRESRLNGFNDWEAAAASGLLNSCYWKRCGELRRYGLIEWLLYTDGTPVHRRGSTGVRRRVSVITVDGLRALEDDVR